MSDNFESFEKNLKFFEEGKEYNTMESYPLSFDSKILELDNIYDTEILLKEMNEISKKSFKYGAICECQNRVLQQLEDEFGFWYAKKHSELKFDSKEKVTEKQKEYKIMVDNEEEYKRYKNLISSESYKLGLIKRVCSALEMYSMKLHSILKYRTNPQE